MTLLMSTLTPFWVRWLGSLATGTYAACAELTRTLHRKLKDKVLATLQAIEMKRGKSTSSHIPSVLLDN